MDQTKPLSENFHRSRLTSMLMSALAFIVSVIDQGKLAELKIFDVEVGALNRTFLLVSLSLAAGISLISLWLAFFNEGLSYLRNANKAFDPKTRSLPTSEEFGSALDKVEAASVEIKNLAESEDLKKAISVGPVQLNEPHIRSLMAGLNPRFLVDTALDGVQAKLRGSDWAPPHSADIVIWIKSELGETIVANVEGYLGGVTYELIGSENAVWDGPSISRLEHEATANLTAASVEVKKLARQIELHRRSLRFSRFTHQAETGWIGLGVPTAMFIVASLHSWGATMWWWWPTLPSLFE